MESSAKGTKGKWRCTSTIRYPLLSLPKGDGDMQAARRHCNAPPIRYLNIWLCGRQTDLSGMGFRMGVFGAVRVGVANFFWGQSIGIDETNTLQLTFFSSIKNCGRHRLGRCKLIYI